jgi:hypothetical protein
LGAPTDPEIAQFIKLLPVTPTNITNYSKSYDVLMKALDLKDSYKIYPKDFPTLYPSAEAPAIDSIPSALITKQQAQQGFLS